MLTKLQEDLKQGMLQKDEIKVSTLRIIIAEIKNAQIAKGQELSDPEIILVLQKEAKKRKEAAEGFRSGGREQSALVEEQELKVIQTYLPEQMTDEELTKIVEESIKEIGAESVQDMGKVIGSVMGKVSGQAEGARVSALAKAKLQG
jgi:uncharacterized protein